MTQAVARIDRESSVDSLLMRAIDKGDIDTLERIVALRDSAIKEAGRRSYFSALAAFQKDCPTLTKTKIVRNKGGDVRYAYAPLDSIVEQVKPYLEKHGFSYTIKGDFPEGGVRAICEVHHIDGHSESSDFVVPVDPDAYMNNQQKAASANTFAKRYAFLNAFGLLTGDDDDDAKSFGEGTNQQDLFKRFRECMDAVLANFETIETVKDAIANGQLDTAYEAWHELTNHEQTSLWLAPTKGGPFTTKEREVMKSNEWNAIRSKYSPEVDKDDLILKIKAADADGLPDLLDLARSLPEKDRLEVGKAADLRAKELKC